MRIEIENTSQMSSYSQRALVYTGVALVGLTTLLSARLNVTINHAPTYDQRALIFGISLTSLGVLGCTAEKICACCSQKKLLPI